MIRSINSSINLDCWLSSNRLNMHKMVLVLLLSCKFIRNSRAIGIANSLCTLTAPLMKIPLIIIQMEHTSSPLGISASTMPSLQRPNTIIEMKRSLQNIKGKEQAKRIKSPLEISIPIGKVTRQLLSTFSRKRSIHLPSWTTKERPQFIRVSLTACCRSRIRIWIIINLRWLSSPSPLVTNP